MSLFRFLWLRRFIRQNTKPIPEDRAQYWKTRLSFAYMIFGWNAFGLVCYMIYTGKADWAKYYGIKDEYSDLPPGAQWAKMLKIPNAQVYRFSGLKKVGEYQIKDGEIVTDKEDGTHIETEETLIE